MGGLASLYAALARPDVFGGALAMSPSIWFANKALLKFAQRTPLPERTRLYLDAGAKEDRSGSVVRNAEALAGVLREKGLPEDVAPLRRRPRGRRTASPPGDTGPPTPCASCSRAFIEKTNRTQHDFLIVDGSSGP